MGAADRLEKLVLTAAAGGVLVCVLILAVLITSVSTGPSPANLTATSVLATNTAVQAALHATETVQAIITLTGTPGWTPTPTPVMPVPFPTGSLTPSPAWPPEVLTQQATLIPPNATLWRGPATPASPTLDPTIVVATALARAICVTPTGAPEPSPTPERVASAPSPTPVREAEPIALDASVQDTLLPDPDGGASQNSYALDIDLPLQVTVQVETTDVLCDLLYLEMVNLEGGVLERQRLRGIGTITLRDVALLEPGQYIVRVRGSEAHAIHYALTVHRGVPLYVEVGEIVYGQTVVGETAVEHQRAAWRFAGQAGDTVTITADGFGTGKDLELRGPDGNTLITGVSGGRREGLIEAYMLLEDGVYTIVVSSPRSSYGPYRLSLFLGETGG